MGKSVSLIFAVCSLLLFMGVGISLSYRSLWLALLLTIAAIAVTGAGFIIKAKLRKRQ